MEERGASGRGRVRVRRALCAFAAGLVACYADREQNVVEPPPSSATRFGLTKLVADTASLGARFIDTLLVNAWGAAFDMNGQLWVANNGTGTVTMYDGQGVKQPLVVTIPPRAGATRGTPTGVVFNMTTSFALPTGGMATFLFAGADGTISAWNASTGSTAVRVVDRSGVGAVYTGIAIASTDTADLLFAADFHNNAVDIFDASFRFLRSFTDTTIADGFAPFGIQNIDGLLFVTFAKRAQSGDTDDPGPGNGYVTVFDARASLVRHFTANGALNSPWGVAQAPTGFGDLGGAILVGNTGDGVINAFNEADGALLGPLIDPAAAPLVLPGLHGMTFGPRPTAPTLFVASGPSNGAHGLVGRITRR